MANKMWLLCLLLTIVISTQGELSLAEKTIAKLDKNEISVSVDGSGNPVFSDEMPVQGLESFLAAVLGQLLFTSESYQLEPGLLSRFDWDFEKKWYVLEIREGLRFHNGRLVKAEDLEFSLVRGLLSKKASWFKSFFANVEGIDRLEGKAEFKSGMAAGIKVLDSRRVAVKLSAPNPSFLHSLARSYFSLVPREELKEDNLTWRKYPIGAGPFRVVSTNRNGSEVHIHRVLKTISGPQSIVFTSKGFDLNSDIIFGFPPAGTSAFRTETSTRANGLTGIFFNYSSKLGADINFRRAIALGIQRSKLVEDVSAYVPNNELLASHFWGRVNAPELRDVERARKLLSKTEIPTDKIRIPVFNSGVGHALMGKYLTELKRQLKEVGLRVEFYKTSEKFHNSNDRGTPFRIMTLGADVTDPTVLLGLFRSGSPVPHHPKSDLEFEKLYLNAADAASTDQRTEAVRRVSQYFLDHAYAVPLFETHASVSSRTSKIRSLGPQYGGLTLYLDRLILQ